MLMKKHMLLKDFLQEVKKTKNRFLSILLIACLLYTSYFQILGTGQKHFGQHPGIYCIYHNRLLLH